MSKKAESIIRLNIQLKGDAADKFIRIKNFIGLENDTEAIRFIISWYFNHFSKDLSGPPKTMWHLNLNDKGVIIWDPFIGKGVQILFSPKGIECTCDGVDDCKHVQFALSKEDIKEVVRLRRKEGWNLPDV
jgi:hypothetical protein